MYIIYYNNIVIILYYLFAILLPGNMSLNKGTVWSEHAIGKLCSTIYEINSVSASETSSKSSNLVKYVETDDVLRNVTLSSLCFLPLTYFVILFWPPCADEMLCLQILHYACSFETLDAVISQILVYGALICWFHLFFSANFYLF